MIHDGALVAVAAGSLGARFGASGSSCQSLAWAADRGRVAVHTDRRLQLLERPDALLHTVTDGVGLGLIPVGISESRLEPLMQYCRVVMRFF